MKKQKTKTTRKNLDKNSSLQENIISMRRTETRSLMTKTMNAYLKKKQNSLNFKLKKFLIRALNLAKAIYQKMLQISHKRK